MLGFLWEMRPYFRQVAGQLVLGSVAGIIMNTAVVLPAILLGRAIDRALAWERGEAATADVGWAALAFVAGTLLTELPRIGKRWWLMTANARIRANVRADAFRGVLAWPMADVQRTPLGDLMARIVGDGARARHRPLGRGANHDGARGECRSHVGDPGASRGYQSAAPLRPGQ